MFEQIIFIALYITIRTRTFLKYDKVVLLIYVYLFINLDLFVLDQTLVEPEENITVNDNIVIDCGRAYVYKMVEVIFPSHNTLTHPHLLLGTFFCLNRALPPDLHEDEFFAVFRCL